MELLAQADTETTSVPIDAIVVPQSDIPNIGLGSLVWIVVFFLLVVYIGLGVVLAYHWIEYMRHRHQALVAISIYAVVGVVLFMILAASAAAIQ